MSGAATRPDPQITTTTTRNPKTKLLKRIYGSAVIQKIRHPLLSLKKRTGHPPELELSHLRHVQETEDEELTELKEGVERVKKDINNKLVEADRLKQEVSEESDKLNDLGSQLDDITKSLTVAERFLSTADRLSQAEIVRAIEVINEEIFQLSSVVAEMVQIEKKYPVQETDRAMFISLLSPIFHSSVLDILLPLQCVDITAIQLGWQAILVHCCCEVIKGWSVGEGFRDMNTELDEAYREIYAKQPQSIAGRWRAITFKAMKKISPEEQDKVVVDVTKTLIALPLACGYINDQAAHEAISTAFYQRMGPLIEKCLELSRIIHEGVISVDIIPYLENSGLEFRSARADLEYEDEEGIEESKTGVIAFTLNLGLCQRGKEDGTDHAPLDPILKAKVIILSTLMETIA